MSRLGTAVVILAWAALVAACTGPNPSSPEPTSPPPGSASPGQTATGALAPSGTPWPLSEIRNHLLSTLGYADEVSADLEAAKDYAAAANALTPLDAVMTDEQRWFDAHAAAVQQPVVQKYGQGITALRKAVQAVVAAGAAAGASQIGAARDALAALLALRPQIEALSG